MQTTTSKGYGSTKPGCERFPVSVAGGSKSQHSDLTYRGIFYSLMSMMFKAKSIVQTVFFHDGADSENELQPGLLSLATRISLVYKTLTGSCCNIDSFLLVAVITNVAPSYTFHILIVALPQAPVPSNAILPANTICCGYRPPRSDDISTGHRR